MSLALSLLLSSLKELSLSNCILWKSIGVVLWHYCANSRDYLWQNRVAILSRKPRTHNTHIILLVVWSWLWYFIQSTFSSPSLFYSYHQLHLSQRDAELSGCTYPKGILQATPISKGSWVEQLHLSQRNPPGHTYLKGILSQAAAPFLKGSWVEWPHLSQRHPLSHLRPAAPILKKYNAPSCLFISANFQKAASVSFIILEVVKARWCLLN